ncbi:MAG: dihydrofolate reductase [Clostridiales bacterium]|nr:dihydrofolate reductase [Clostridiales bacterium]
MKAIVAVDKNWGIGKNNGLLFSIPEDMKFFRKTTLNKIVVMGGNTLRSFPGGNPLKNRTNIVLSRKIERDDCTVVKSYDQLFSVLKNYPQDEIFIIGGASVYKEMLSFCSEIFVTKVDADGNADVFFENLDNIDGWCLSESSQEIVDNGYKLKFTIYKNLNPKSI